MLSTLVIDGSALARLEQSGGFSPQCFCTFAQNELPVDVARIQVKDVVFLLGPDAINQTRLLVVSLVDTGLFQSLKEQHRNETLRRIIQIGAHPKQRVPTSWAPFHAGSKLSIQAVPYAMLRDPPRIEFELDPDGLKHTYLYTLDKTKRRLETVQVPMAVLHHALSLFDEAALRRSDWTPPSALSETAQLVLSPLDNRISLGIKRRDWLNGRLTSTQQRFLDTPLTQSLRLFGAAGTGKSLSLVLKCIAELGKRFPAEPHYRALFLTHSQSTVDTVKAALFAVDDDGLLANASEDTVQVCTLLELANQAMRYDRWGLQLLSTDGVEGRQLQREAIRGQLQGFIRGDWVAYRARCSDAFVEAIEADPGTPQAMAFANAVINEVNCVLEAEGVRDNEERRARYLIGKDRKPWMMPLANEEERRVLLRLYDLFRRFLQEMNAMGAGQMVADYLGFLDNNLWNNARRAEGWDAVFVDEFHLFDRQEQHVLQYLTKDPHKAPLLVMAYDNKQSVQDTFFSEEEARASAVAFRSDIGAGKTVPFELTQGFRYTPAIAAVLEKLDQSFPALGLPDELGSGWKPMVNLSRGGDIGDRPQLHVFATDLELFKAVFDTAKTLAKNLERPRRLAVLCINESLFRRYAEAGTYREDFFLISDREDVARMRFAGKKYFFSMPEFVAGLQFDTVLLMHVNEKDVSTGPYGPAAFRRYVSAVYLGASRAERELHIYASNERGGPSRALQHATESGVLAVS